MCGGGGAGGGGNVGTGNSVGGGGAAGAALDFVINGPIAGGPVVIGAGGLGVLASAGAPGGTTSVTINAVVYSAAPGDGGQRENSLSPEVPVFALGGFTLPGSSAVGIVSGDNGMQGSMVQDPGLIAVGGSGGSGRFGIGGPAFNSGGNGLPGTGNGSGGSGGRSPFLGVDTIGGDGTSGVVVIDEYL